MALRDLNPQELAEFAGHNDPSMIEVDAPNNSVLDEKNDRVLSLPQTLNADETQFVIDRDIDGKSQFFAQQPIEGVGLPPAQPSGKLAQAGRGIGGFFASLPSVWGAMKLEKGEGLMTGREHLFGVPENSTAGLMMGGVQVPETDGEELMRKRVGEALATDGALLIDRNRKYMAEAGWAKRDGDGIMYDIGQGGASLLASVGVAGLTRSPASAAVLFGALQKSNIYVEAREAGVDPDTASSVSTVAGVAEAALEKVGLDRFMKGMKGNSMVKRFVTGFVTEGVQEGSQQAAEEGITNATGIRKESATQIAQSILYNAALGAIIGGPTNAALGHFVSEDAKEQGLDPDQAEALGKYAETNIDTVKQDVGEFVNKEVAPLAADDKSAAEFMTLMQRFDNRIDVVDREALSPEEKAVFDEYLDYFNNAVTDTAGIEGVEKEFFDKLTAAGVEKEQAVGAAKLIGARADAASRALGITPKEWYDAHNLNVKVSRTPEEAKTIYQEKLEELRAKDLEEMRKRLEQAREGEAAPKGPKKPLLSWIKRRGGVRTDSDLAQELRNMGLTSKTAPGLYTKKRGGGELDNIPASEFNDRFGVQSKEDGNGYVDRGWLLEQLDEELRGRRINQAPIDEDEGFLRAIDDAGLDINTATAEQVYEAIGPEGDVIAQAKILGEEINSKQAREILGVQADEKLSSIDEAIERWQERVAIAQEGITRRQGPRGDITFTPDETLIRLFEGANPSTILHELGHLFLRDMRNVSQKSRRPMVKRDYKIVKEWLGAKGDILTEEQEEKFARGFEAYLREGKAPVDGLKGVFERFKQWLTQIYKSVRDLDVDINDDIRQVFDRMLGGDFARTESQILARDEAKMEADYQRVAAPPSSTFGGDASNVIASAGQLASNIFTPISSRLGRIHPKLKAAVRKFTFQTGLQTQEDRKRALPFLEAMEGMSEEDYRIFDFALKNRDEAKIKELVKKYKAGDAYAAVTEMLDEIYSKAQETGMDLAYLQSYFPRMVRLADVNEYLNTLRGTENWSAIAEAMEAEDPKGMWTDEEKAVFVNKYLRGLPPGIANALKPSFTKERKVDYVEPEHNRFYLPSGEALLQYISSMRLGIAQREVFGKGENADESIGAYVASMVKQGVINHEQEAEVKLIMGALINTKGPGVFVSWIKNAGYVYLMGSPISAITQIQDLAFSLAKNGYYRTGISLTKALTGNSILTKEELGIDNIAREFEDETRASRAVRMVFKAIGLEWMDNIGKQVYIESSYKRLQAQAKTNSAEFQDYMANTFGEEADQVRKDLLDGTLSDNVKELLYSELSDVQPISLAEMPVGYLRGGNWRSLYMLKTYTIKQIDIYRTQVFDKMASGDAKQTADGAQMLVKLSVALMLMGMGSDALKDLILGRPIDLDNLVVDNVLKTLGITKYQIYQTKQDGVANTAMQYFFVPPLYAPVDNLVKDLQKISEGKMKPKDAQSLSYVPGVGKFYYWWYGGGKEKLEKQRKKRKD